ncbi:unnamed protein product [Calicophoron daubneyi]|uniref:Uncharacterized protein n=1 Tax=Calicophoron daubneyi TaxID=300641 RepID=A0AAV2TBT9_CALDB
MLLRPCTQSRAELLQSNLAELLKLAALEVQLGRWHRSSSTSDPEGPLPPIDRFLIEPLTRTLQLDAAPVLQLIYFVCGLSSEWLDSCAAVLQCNEPARIRLELLNPSRLLMDCLDPLAHVGIRNPQKLLTRCPDLILACAVPPPQLSLNKDDTGSKKSEHRRETALTSALDEIGSLIARNDLVSLINRFPAVLLRPPNELAEMYTYLTEEMGLQSTEIIRFAKTPNHRHSLRHISGLRLVACPAWCLPIEHVRARHSLSLLAGCWPPKNSIDETKVSPDEKLAALLTCSPGEFWSWLRRSPGKVSGTNQSVSELESAVAFKADDIKIFEHMISRVVHDTEKSTDDDSVSKAIGLVEHRITLATKLTRRLQSTLSRLSNEHVDKTVKVEWSSSAIVAVHENNSKQSSSLAT